MSSKTVPSRPLPRLYLATPAIDDPQPLAKVLPSLLEAADVAAVLLRLKLSDPRTLISRIKALAPIVQDKGTALLLEGNAGLVARAGADGAHLSGLTAFEEALPTLKPDYDVSFFDGQTPVPALHKALHGLLRPGGTLITANLNHGGTAEAVRKTLFDGKTWRSALVDDDGETAISVKL